MYRRRLMNISRRRCGRYAPRTLVILMALFQAVFIQGETAPNNAPEPPPPTTPREFYNAGTAKLEAGKLLEAESLLETVLASQTERLQPPALYNLGHVRFDQGLELLKKGPAAGPTNERGQAAAAAARNAAEGADAALASDDVQKMVAAYLRGRGIRRELKAATKAVQVALETHGAALNKWQRSEGDFKSTLELHHPDADARQNVDTVDRCIAKLVDTVRQMRQTLGQMGQQNQNLGQKLKQLRGRIPAPDMPPGAAGDDDDDEDLPNGPKEGQKEGPSKQGEEMKLSPEQAGWLLEAYRLDSERRLPMGQQQTGDPRERNRLTW
jgi:hypothetical protein